MEKVYACIDLKSFYASCECQERGLDPLKTNLVVADPNRTDKTICLAVSPSLKKYGLSGRSRLYEVIQKVTLINNERRKNIHYKPFKGSSYLSDELLNPYLKLDYIVAPPRMSLYLKYSQDIYNIYLKYISEEDLFSYSIDEVFFDLTGYLKTYQMTPRELVTKMIHDVYKETGITATAGIGTNLYLAKIAMDVDAKHSEPDECGVRLSILDEMSYRKKLWNLRPLTMFWRFGKGICQRLEEHHIYTMGDIARCSLDNEDLLYRLFGVNAELIIDHAWGYEPCTIKDVKNYRPSSSSISTGQVLHIPYDYLKARLIILEMSDNLALDLTEKFLVTNQIVLNIIYDVENINNFDLKNKYSGLIVEDGYGRKMPKPSHGIVNLKYYTSSSKIIMEQTVSLFDQIVNRNLLIRKINICANNVILEKDGKKKTIYQQFDLFSDNHLEEKKMEEDLINLEKENKIQHTIIDIKKKYGKNAILKGMNLEEGATAISRNKQIGGHSE